MASCANMSKKSNLLQDLSNQLTCSICLDHYKVPKTVTPCLHTFCQMCLQDTIDSTAVRDGNTGKFPCPKCRRNIEFDCPDITAKENAAEQQFTTNFDIQSQLEMIKSKIDSGCKEHAGEMLMFYCQTCHELICQLCLQDEHLPQHCIFSSIKAEAETIRAEYQMRQKAIGEIVSRYRKYVASV